MLLSRKQNTITCLHGCSNLCPVFPTGFPQWLQVCSTALSRGTKFVSLTALVCELLGCPIQDQIYWWSSVNRLIAHLTATPEDSYLFWQTGKWRQFNISQHVWGRYGTKIQASWCSHRLFDCWILLYLHNWREKWLGLEVGAAFCFSPWLPCALHSGI